MIRKLLDGVILSQISAKPWSSHKLSTKTKEDPSLEVEKHKADQHISINKSPQPSTVGSASQVASSTQIWHPFPIPTLNQSYKAIREGPIFSGASILASSSSNIPTSSNQDDKRKEADK